MNKLRGWVPGLLPLALIGVVAGFWQQGRVEQDLGARGGRGLAKAGLEWTKIEIAGRDAVITGEAYSPELRQQALKTLEETFGIRRADDRMSVLPEAKPFTFTALRDGAKITLTGAVPPGSVRAGLIETIRTAAPGAAIVDELKPARGSVAAFPALAAFGLTELGKLDPGSLSISDNAISLSGRAADFAKYADIRSRLAAVPAGGRLTKGLGVGDILPPVARPFTFAAERSAAGVVLSGFVPSEDARARLAAEARALSLPVRDALQLADGAPQGDWTGAAALLVRELAKLEAGKASLADDKATITGRAKDLVVEEDIRNDLKALPAGYPLVQVAIEARAVRPYVFTATRGSNGVLLEGYVPDAKTRTDVLEVAKRFFEGERVEDRLAEALGAPGDFMAALRAGLQALARLEPGAQVALNGETLTMKGAALFDFARGQITAEFARTLPGNFRGSSLLVVAPLPPPVTQSPECQLMYNDLMSRGTVRFRSGSAELSDESRAIVDRLTVVSLRCVNARLEIGGHTDSDGSAQSNAELSRRRAETVAAYMVRAGVPVERLEPVGYGQTVPVAPNDTAENKLKNRRIEFIVK